MLARLVGKSKKYVDMLKQGWNEVPHLYGSLGLGFAALVIFAYRTAATPPGGHIVRFKERYMVMRPDDERLIGYPKEYVTDKHLLK